MDKFEREMIKEEHNLRRNIHGRNARNNPRLVHELGLSSTDRV